MRRPLAMLVSVLFALAGMLSRPAMGSSAPADGEDPGRGVVHAGLRPGRADGLCKGKFELESSPTGQVSPCTHGPDPSPPGIDVRERRNPPPAGAASDLVSGVAAATIVGTSVPCYGDGTSGDRVQLIFAHAADVADRYASWVASMRQAAAATDGVYNRSAGETGGARHVRFVTDAACNLVVSNVTLSASGDDNFNNTVNELHAKGFNRSDRKYLVWTDANVYCGIGQIYYDDSAAATNYNNGVGAVQGMVARVDNGCWNLSGQSVEAHELMHNLGGVQSTAPHATASSHCWDESDRMCYDDYGANDGTVQLPNGTLRALLQVCAVTHENTFDCNHDDYFHTAPPGGSYLATHWNVAGSAFLDSGSGSVTPPPPPPPVATTITVKAPNGGETLVRGRSTSIEWTYTGTPGATVRIQLLRKGAVVSTLSAGAPTGSAGSGAFAWVPSPSLQPTGSYQVRVSSVTSPTVTDTSNATFSLR